MRVFWAVALVLSACGLTTAQDASSDLLWWQKAVFYQIYPRSYMDSNGDGIGDIPGIISKLDYLKDLGIDAIWFSPLSPSPMRDTGYDQTDYEDIEPDYGTLDDFDDLVAGIHQRGLRLITDLVPCYTSMDHPWFVKSVNREGKYTDYYIWSDGQMLDNGTVVPPSNWLSVFGGSAWEWHPVRQQYFYHSFVKSQPNLNHRDTNVEWEMRSIVRFWLDRGVDGFRVDAIQQLYVNANYTENEPLSGAPGVTSFEFGYNIHTMTEDQPEVVPTVKTWHDVLDEYEAEDGKERYMIIETYAPLDTKMELYKTGGVPFNFGLILGSGHPKGTELRDTIMEYYNSLPSGAWPNFVLGNHDQPRASTKYGYKYVDVYNMLLLTLWGTPTTYYGEELGMLAGVISWEETMDNFGCNFGPDRYMYVSRDPERTPMQWDDGYQAGFTTGNSTWLPLAENYTELNVKTEQDSAGRTSLKLYKQLVELRNRSAFQGDGFQESATDDNIFSYIREGGGERYLVVLNVGDDDATADFSADAGEANGVVVAVTPTVESYSEKETVALAGVTVSPGQGVILQIVSDSGDIVG